MKEKFLKAVSSELKIIRIENGDSQEELALKLKPYNYTLSIFFARVIAKTQKQT